VALVALAGTAIYAAVVDPLYAVRWWLAWRLLTLWGAVALLHISCLGGGAAIVMGVLRVRDRPALETAVLSMTVGVVAWVTALYLAGALGFYGVVLAVLLPLGFLAAGLRWLRVLVSQAMAAVGPAGVAPPLFARASWVAGTLALGWMYLGLLSPDSINYDSAWCHLTVAQDYAREGRIVAFPADYARNVPQLTPLFHLWGFLLPVFTQPLRWMFALHNEFALFLWTLAGVSAAVSWIAGRAERGPSGSWAVFLLFPGLFVYDSNIGGAADHVLAFFAVPTLLATARLMRTWTVRDAVLWGIIAGGALGTKYQAFYFLVPAVAALMVGFLRVALRRRGSAAAAQDRGSSWKPALTAVALAGVTLVIVVGPHFLRNVIFHRNPFYPLMQDLFTASRPRMPDSALQVATIFTDTAWQPKGPLGKRIGDALGVFATFSFVPHYTFRGNWPAFGSLFTLTLPLVIFLGWQRRLWVAAAMASGALLLWAMTFVVDRNLQTFLPLLMTTAAAIIVLGWRLGRVARMGIVALVGFQLLWGGDAFFYSANDRVRSALELIVSGFNGRAKTRFATYRNEYIQLGRALPPDAKVLLHAEHVSLGFDRTVLLDWAGFQGLIDYRGLNNVRELHERLRSFGITHIVHIPGARAASSKAEEVLFAAYVNRYAQRVGAFGGFQLLALPAQPPPITERWRALVLGGVAGYGNGLYDITQLGVLESFPPAHQRYPGALFPAPPDKDLGDLLARAHAVVVTSAFAATRPALLQSMAATFRAERTYAGFTVYIATTLR
jgi:hypothetical protein